MPQEEVVANKILDKYKWLDFVIGTHNIPQLIELIYKSLDKQELKIEVFSCEGNIIEGMPFVRDNKYKAFVNIMYGCDKFCTYCIVPYTRGKQRSRNPQDILKEIDSLIVMVIRSNSFRN
jgi:tRNA-2-methylthio-N6-dimethylallyladenosine synthase